MKKALILGLAVAGTAAAVYAVKKLTGKKCSETEENCEECNTCGCDCDDEYCGECCGEACEIPAEKAEEQCVTEDCGCCEEEVLDKIEEPVESDEV